jgi:2-desacetyl-2-hydroxyethyl bacteriochlorophyllide A dehydrogenase
MDAVGLSFVAPRRVEWVQIELPPLLDGDVLVRTLYSGISTGSELLAYRGDVDPKLPLDETIGALGGTFNYPFRYGYSCVGTVSEGAGLEVDTLVFAFSPHQTAVIVPMDEVVVLDNIDPRHATLFPLLETALQICLDAGAVDGKVVAILGLGPVGLLSGALLDRSGAHVVGGEPRAWRRRIAGAFGIEAFDPAELPDFVDEHTGGVGIPLVIEASGSPDALSMGLDLLAHEGTALVASWYGSKPVRLPLGGRFHRRRLTVRSTQVSTIPAALANEWTIARRRRAAARLITELPIDLIATHVWPHLSAAEAFAAIDGGTEGLLHAALAYD